MQRPLRHHDALPLQQLMRLDHGQAVLVEPLLELIPMRIEQTAGFAPTVGAMRPNHLDHLTQQQVGQLLLTRSEEHTSELQSLMRISYSVFCLKTKTKTIIH